MLTTVTIRLAAADLLSQAEHDPSSQAILITDCDHFAQKVIDSVASQLSTLPRVEIAGASWNAFGAVITVKNLAADAPTLANALAAEHLIITAQPDVQETCIRPSNTLAPFSLDPIHLKRSVIMWLAQIMSFQQRAQRVSQVVWAF